MNNFPWCESLRDVQDTEGCRIERNRVVLKETSRIYFIRPRSAGIPDEVDIAIGKTYVVIQHAVLETHNTPLTSVSPSRADRLSLLL